MNKLDGGLLCFDIQLSYGVAWYIAIADKQMCTLFYIAGACKKESISWRIWELVFAPLQNRSGERDTKLYGRRGGFEQHDVTTPKQKHSHHCLNIDSRWIRDTPLMVLDRYGGICVNSSTKAPLSSQPSTSDTSQSSWWRPSNYASSSRLACIVLARHCRLLCDDYWAVPRLLKYCCCRPATMRSYTITSSCSARRISSASWSSDGVRLTCDHENVMLLRVWYAKWPAAMEEDADPT